MENKPETKEFEFSDVLNTDPKSAQQCWLEEIWYKAAGVSLGGLVVEDFGDEVTGEGSDRRFLRNFIREKLVKVEDGVSCYKVYKGPFEYHYATVTFKASPENSKQTIITWNVEYKFKSSGLYFLVTGLSIKTMQFALKNMVKYLKKSIDKKEPTSKIEN